MKESAFKSEICLCRRYLSNIIDPQSIASDDLGEARKRKKLRVPSDACRAATQVPADPDYATHNATHNKDDLQVLRRTYAAVRNLQVVEWVG
jgi:hypothetical protein